METEQINEDTYKIWEEQSITAIKILEDKIKKIDKEVKKQIAEARARRKELISEIKVKKFTLEKIKKNCNQLITGKIPERKKKEKPREIEQKLN